MAEEVEQRDSRIVVRRSALQSAQGKPRNVKPLRCCVDQNSSANMHSTDSDSCVSEKQPARRRRALLFGRVRIQSSWTTTTNNAPVATSGTTIDADMPQLIEQRRQACNSLLYDFPLNSLACYKITDTSAGRRLGAAASSLGARYQCFLTPTTITGFSDLSLESASDMKHISSVLGGTNEILLPPRSDLQVINKNEQIVCLSRLMPCNIPDALHLHAIATVSHLLIMRPTSTMRALVLPRWNGSPLAQTAGYGFCGSSMSTPITDPRLTSDLTPTIMSSRDSSTSGPTGDIIADLTVRVCIAPLPPAHLSSRTQCEKSTLTQPKRRQTLKNNLHTATCLHSTSLRWAALCCPECTGCSRSRTQGLSTSTATTSMRT
ncbi:hypothetical protein FA95DRAFT_626632 [Auriscalpium vulgare]|uniref:Uncharacterized protein n=1 Tax=Auriscalpium vulgare TaxID=40419 RepID=A0ACB8RCX2_9AGAM|nr:hypothetical protein FA95DRAFT_626632 [Auriscalpium vulgare]